MKIMLFDLLSTCVSASLCCLTGFCAVKARQHSTPADATESVRNGYNSDACAVSAIWLIVVIWLVDFSVPKQILYGLGSLWNCKTQWFAFSIFSCVTISRGGSFITVDEGLSFITQVLKGFMLGFAIATGVSLFILPITSRGHVFQDIKDYVSQIDAVLQAQLSFVKRSSTSGVWTGDQGLLERTRTAQSNGGTESNGESSLESKKQQLVASMGKLNALHGKLQSDLFYSKDEFAWGKLSAGDLNRIGDLLRSIFLPLSGMAMLPDILDMMVKSEGTRNNSMDSLEDSEEDLKRSGIKKVLETFEERLGNCTDLMRSGLQYVLVIFGLTKPKHLEKQLKRNNNSGHDEESKGDIVDPLQQDFTAQFEQALSRYYSRRKELPKMLASLEAFSSPEKHDGMSTESSSEMLADHDIR